MTTRRLGTALLVASTLAAGTAAAGPRDVAICVTRIGGDSASAQPYVERFLRYIETAAGWPAGSTKGSFLVTRKEATAFMSEAKPGIGMLDPPLYYELRAGQQLQPILQGDSDDLVSKRFHVVVKDPAVKSLADVKGKRLWTTLADTPRYLSKVVLDDQVDAAAQFTLKQVGQALKGVRGVLRGDCDATILDDEQLARAREITGGQDLRAIYSSPALPRIPVVVFGTAVTAADRDALVKVLLAMCGTDKGGAICREMHIGKFVPLDAAAIGDAQKRFDR
jgi:ABC-type phosphate/phosphonate transport system substrate-binding protein